MAPDPLYKHLFHRHQSPKPFPKEITSRPTQHWLFHPPGPGNKIVSLALGSASCHGSNVYGCLFLLTLKTIDRTWKKSKKNMASRKHVEYSLATFQYPASFVLPLVSWMLLVLHRIHSVYVLILEPSSQNSKETWTGTPHLYTHQLRLNWLTTRSRTDSKILFF